MILLFLPPILLVVWGMIDKHVPGAKCPIYFGEGAFFYSYLATDVFSGICKARSIN